MKIATDSVLITADNTNVFDGRMQAPKWARKVRVQVLASDYDWLISAVIDGEELMREGSPHAFGADNTGVLDWRRPHILMDIKDPGRHEILVNVNVVTGGTGIVLRQYED